MSIQIEPAIPGDAPTIAGFQLKMALETENKKLNLNDIVLPAVEAVIEDAAKGFYLVARENGAVVGSLMVTYEWSDWRNCNMWYIQSVFVERDFRGRGIFKSLYERVIEMAREEGTMFVRLYVETENKKAQEVYERLGMKRMPYYMYDVQLREYE